MIGTLVLKDLKLFFRNQFFAVITGLTLVMFTAIYFLIPNEVNNSLGLAFYIENPDVTVFDELITEEAEADNLQLFDSEEAMLAALEESGDLLVGLTITEAAALASMNGEPAEFQAYYAPGIPAEAKEMFADTLELIANATNPTVASNLKRMNQTEIVLGNDILGTPISFRERFLPMLLLFIMTVEVLGLATLIAREIESGTARALVTSPLRLHHFFTSKALMGMGLAFGQVLLIVLVTGTITTSPILLLTTLLLGTLLIVGLGFFVAAISPDATSVTAWGAFVLIFMTIPAITVMLPGLASGWMEIVPSFYFVDALHQILNFNAGWADVGQNLLLLFVTSVGLLGIGTAVLRRRF
ncbi:MAG: ABC transporter permease [Chloroflexota bacterium]